ncbi:MAG: nitrilase-related carbon-nitrogen hydrolase [Pseudomonadota bacterium]
MPKPATFAILIAGGLLLAMSQGHWAIPIFAFLAPVFLVRWVRSTSTAWAYVGFVVAHTLAWYLAYWGMVPLPEMAQLGLFTGLSMVLGLVFLADRWASKRSSGLLATLVLPCGWVLFDFMGGLFSPNGTWGSIAYTFGSELPLVQVVSVTGWTGLTFLVAWFATIANRVWEQGSTAWPIARFGIIAFTFVFALGGLRLALSPPAPQTLRAAAIVAPGTFQTEHINELWRYTRGVEQSPEADDLAKRRIAESIGEHFALVVNEAEAGADLVVWAEANLSLTETEEADWLERARRIAQEQEIHLGMGATVFRPETGERTKNTLVLINPQGDIEWEFLKATRVPGSGNVIGDGILPQLDTDQGRWTAAICFDLDFPRLMRQAGVMDADVLIAPSNDWIEVRETHLRMHALRAVEQGVTLFRPTKDGISATVDPYGRVLARLDTETSPAKVLVTNLPTEGVATIYSRIGDSFSWLSSALFFGLLILIRRHAE